ncbi:MAG: hypothetical protein CLLPBCKN_000151 [Chroococcidiopsis cubana SAG 39.79]|jgi:hypothetical protein|nr:hypothetical protein [Chroococcidiopsis cubana SAG 39.79]
MINFLNLTKISKAQRAKINSVIENSPDFHKIYKPYKKVKNYPDFREATDSLKLPNLNFLQN